MHKYLTPLQQTQFARHDDVIKWKHFPRHWPFVRGIHRSPVNSPHKGQWRVALMFSLICARIKGWVNNRDACDLRRYRAHYDVTVMSPMDLMNPLQWYHTGVMASHVTANSIVFQQFVQPCIKENMKAPRDWPLVRGIHRWRWIPLTKGQYQ